MNSLGLLTQSIPVANSVVQQAVYVAMVKIARDFTDHDIQQKYLNACARFRFPYWDPCLPRQTSSPFGQADFGVPKIVSTRIVHVRKPDNPELLVPLDNPLYAFNFPTEVQPLDNPDFSWGEQGNVRSLQRPLSRNSSKSRVV